MPVSLFLKFIDTKSIAYNVNSFIIAQDRVAEKWTTSNIEINA